MKKILLLLIGLSGATFSAWAQQRPSAVDSVLKRSGLKLDTGLFNNKVFSQQLSAANYLKLNQLNAIPGVLASNLNSKRVTRDQLDHMPVLHTAGNSKMPTLKAFGQSKMPVTGKDAVKLQPLNRP